MSEDDAFLLERLLLSYYMFLTDYPIANITYGGRNPTHDYIGSPYQTIEFRSKISELVQGKDNPNYGHRWNDEMKRRLSQKALMRGYDGAGNPNAKPIRCIETNEEFQCIKDAQEKYGVKTCGSFTWALKYPTRTAAGLHWEYI